MASESATAPVLGMLEMARVLSTLVDIISSTPSSIALGEMSEDSDPICEGLRRLIERKAPLLVQREVVPGHPETIEVFDVRDMVFDSAYAAACLAFRRDTAIPESGMDYNEIVERLGQWRKPISVTGAYSFESTLRDERSEREDD